MADPIQMRPPPDHTASAWAEPDGTPSPDVVDDGDSMTEPVGDAAPATVLDEIVLSAGPQLTAGSCRCGRMRPALGAAATHTPSASRTTSAPGGLVIITRSQWAARPPKSTTRLKHPVDTVFIHHTAGTVPQRTLEAEQAKMRAIQREHQVNRGWSDIGYSFVIMPSGRIGEGRGWGVVGAHTENHNSHSVGISFAGTYDAASPSSEAMTAARRLIAEGVRLGVLRPDFVIRGHRDVKSTACPGQRLYDLMQSLDPRR